MAVEIDFKPDAHAAAAATADDSEARLREVVLFVPVRLRVDGRDMLLGSGPTAAWDVDSRGTARPSTPVEDEWASQPLMGFLLGLEEAVGEAARLGAARLRMAGGHPDLTFRHRDVAMLEVTPATGSAPAAAPILEFLEALALFHRTALDWLEAAAPHLRAHPAWAEWFPTAAASGQDASEGHDAIRRPDDIAEH